MPDEEFPSLPQTPTQSTPLLSSDHHLLPHTTNPNGSSSTTTTLLSRLRRSTARFLTSKLGHYSVILLVALDVSCIFADFLIALHICEHTCHVTKTERDAKRSSGFNEQGWRTASDALDIVSLVISCLFMVELLASLWAFGLSYLKNWFHILDATVIVVGFVIDVVFHGTVEEVGSLVVVGRLWRVFKIVEEFGVAGEDTVEELRERVAELEKEVEVVKKQRDHWTHGARKGVNLARGHSHGHDGDEGVFEERDIIRREPQ